MDATVWNKQLAMKALQLIAVERRYTPLALHWSDAVVYEEAYTPTRFSNAWHTMPGVVVFICYNLWLLPLLHRFPGLFMT
jgi:hypothetical protein